MCRVLALLALVAGTGCGRFGFDEIERDLPGDGPRDGGGDAIDGGPATAVSLVAPEVAGDNDRFGSRVVVSADGSTLAIGAYGEASNATGINGEATNNAANLSGAVYVFTRVGPSWTQQAYIKASNTEAVDVFGWSVSLSGTGNVLVVGAPNEASDSRTIGAGQTSNGAALAGAAYVFRRTGTTWTQEAYLKPSNLDAGDAFGETVAISDDGATIAVGAIHEDGDGTGASGNPASNALLDAGAVYVFVRPQAVWLQESYLKASNPNAGDSFGVALAVSGDGARLAVSATGEASGAAGIDGNQLDNSQPQAGAVYVFDRGGNTWSQEAYVKASNPDGGDFFGYSLELSFDGRTLAVTAEGEDSPSTGIDGPQLEGAGQAGAAYVFVRGPLLATEPWTQQAYIKASNTAPEDRFGRSIALSADGGRLVVGAPQEDSGATGLDGDQSDDSALDSGAAYAYTRTGTTWSFIQYIKASNPASGDAFGGSVAVSATGGVLAIGAADTGNSHGTVYLVE